MPDDELPRSADVVVIGGGVVGCSAAYHLAEAGLGRVVLLERDKLGCGTSWHSAANIAILDVSARAFIDFYTYSRQVFESLEEDTGQAVGWRETGRVQIATDEPRLEALRHINAVAAANGVSAHIIDADEVGRCLPMLRIDDVLGALWTPSTGRVNATDLIAAYAKSARKRGTVIIERAPVTGIEVDGSGVAAVVTSAGRIATRRIANCAGLWAPEVARLVGVRLPIHANEHFYILTKPFDGIRRDMPAFRDADAGIYGREEVGGLLLGCFERRAKPIAVDALPENFSFGLLPEDWDQFEPYMLAALHRIPALRNAEIKLLLNGPESFTPDGKFLLGPCPGTEGFYVLAGMNSAGVNFSAGAGRGLAELMTGRTPSCDLTPFDPMRFARFHSNPEWLRERIAESPGYLYALGRAGRDYETGRRLRRSPLQAHLEAQGMRFGSVLGWERPELGAKTGESEADARRREWTSVSAAVALYDATAAGRFLVPWSSFADALDGRIDLAGFAAGQCRCVTIPDAMGGGRTRAIAVRLEPDMVLVIVEAEREALDAAVFGIERHGGIDPVTLAASGLAQILIAGPRAVDLLLAVAPDAARLRAGHACPIDVGGAEGVAARLPDSGHWLLTLHAEFAGRAYERMEASALEMGGGPVGRRIMELDRVLRAIPAVGREIIPTIPVAALSRAPDDVNGGPRLIAAWADLPLGGGEPLRAQGEPVGFVTSAATLPDGPTALIGYVRCGASDLQVAGGMRSGVLRPRDMARSD